MRVAAGFCLVLLTAFVLSACGGSEKTGPGSGDSSGQPPAAAVATEPADPWLLPPPKARTRPAATVTPGTGSLGVADRAAARRISDAFRATGGDLTGLEVFVFPLKGSDKTLLVFEIDATSAASLDGSSPPAAEDLFTAALLTSDAVKQAKVSRVVVNVRGKDETTGAAIVFSITLPLETLAGYLAGSISEDQAGQLTQFQIKETKP